MVTRDGGGGGGVMRSCSSARAVSDSVWQADIAGKTYHKSYLQTYIHTYMHAYKLCASVGKSIEDENNDPLTTHNAFITPESRANRLW